MKRTPAILNLETGCIKHCQYLTCCLNVHICPHTYMYIQYCFNHLAATNTWEILSQDRIYASILVKNQSWDHSNPISVKKSHKNKHFFEKKITCIHVLGVEEVNDATEDQITSNFVVHVHVVVYKVFPILGQTN